MKKKTFTLDLLVEAMHAKNIASQSLQPQQKKPYNIGSQTFSDGTPFVGPVLSPTKPHSVISLVNQT